MLTILRAEAALVKAQEIELAQETQVHQLQKQFSSAKKKFAEAIYTQHNTVLQASHYEIADTMVQQTLALLEPLKDKLIRQKKYYAQCQHAVLTAQNQLLHVEAADQTAKNACIQILVTAGLPLEKSLHIVTLFKIGENNSQHFLSMINQLSNTYNLNENSLIIKLEELNTFENLVAKIAEIQQAHPTTSDTTTSTADSMLCTTSSVFTQAAPSDFKIKDCVILDELPSPPAFYPLSSRHDALSPLANMAQVMNTFSPTAVFTHQQPSVL